MSRRIVIVGAGPGGLASAMLLAKTGADVTVVERLDRIGGRSSTIEAEGGYRFDMGPTFFLYPRVLRDIFAACGKDLDREVDLIRLDPQYHLIFEAGGELKASGDPATMAEQVAKLCPADAANLPRFMADNRRKLAAFRPVLEKAFSSALDLLDPALLKSLPLMRPHQSVDADLGRYFSDPRVRLAFSFQSKYLGMSPFRCPSLFTILSFMEYEFGVFHPRGGTGAVMAAMARAATDMGVRIRLSEPVEEILFEGRKAVGVRTPAGEYRADALVLNSDFAQTMSQLVPNHLRRRWTDEKLERKKFSCSTFMLYLGLEGELPDLAHHTIYLTKDYARNIKDIEDGLELPGEPSFYVQNACVTDPELAPKGHSALYVLVPVAHRTGGIDWQKEKARYRSLVLKRLERIGLKDIEKRIRYEKVLTPEGWENDMQIYRGATFNLAHSLDQMLHLRPRNKFEDLEGVYLVGGGTHPGSGLPVIFESARITSRLMADQLGLSHDWEAGTHMAAGQTALIQERVS
ncbi:phytoene desaturase [Skermanella stibiiresistens SB22]|uniref:Phytoene desaturase n=1 Tax=Skermanella stibiiresistens SB22 TaxID=1385369 RepID=W9GZR7_9PROT|nr:phytoene desaturase family protein [Skermanella stibiiresistens]EWY37952.1 phytoene desaturase [Skermanella stibiiresistens SB22]